MKNVFLSLILFALSILLNAQSPNLQYKLDGNSVESIIGLNGSANGFLLFGKPDRFNNDSNAAYFNGTNAFIQGPQNAPVFDTLSGFTLSTWFKTNLTTGSKILIDKPMQFGLWITNGKIKFQIQSQAPDSLIGNKIVSIDQWHLATGVYKGDSLLLFLDGELIASKIKTGFINPFGGFFFIGGNPSNLTNFNGYLDDASFYRTKLNRGEVKNLYNPVQTDTSLMQAKFSYQRMAIRYYKFSVLVNSGLSNRYWNFGDGMDTVVHVNTVMNINHLYGKEGYYNVCLTETEYTGKKSTICQKVHVESLASTSLASSDISLDVASIVSNTVNFNTSNYLDTTTTLKLYWDFGDGATDSLPNPQHVYAKSGTYNVLLYVKHKASNRIFSTSITIRVNKTCEADFDHTVYDFNNSAQCISKAKNAAKYFWILGDGQVSTESSPLHTYSKPGQYSLTQIIVDGTNTCTDMLTKSISVGRNYCNAEFDYFVNTTKQNVLFKNTSIGHTNRYYWIFGDGTTFNRENPSHTFKYPGVYSIKLIVYDSVNKCMDQKEKNILVGKMDLDCEADYIYRLENNTAFFTNTSIGNGLRYVWNFGDTANTTNNLNENPSFTFSKSGIYKVCLSAINDSGFSNITCKSIAVGNNPSTNCEAKMTYINDTASSTATFYDNSPSVHVRQKWFFDDNTSATTIKTSHTFATAGFHKVMLRIQTASGCVAQDYALVRSGNVNDTLCVDFSMKIDSTNLKASGYPVDFIGISHGDAAKLKWSFGDGTIDTTSINPTHYYATAKTYEVCIEIWDPITEEYSISCDSIRVGSASAINEINDGKNVSSLKVSPNPATDLIQISYYIQNAGKVQIKIFALDGTEIRELMNENRKDGNLTIAADINNLKAGIYILQAINNGKSEALLFVKK